MVWPRTGKTTSRATNRVTNETAKSMPITAAQASIGPRLASTARTLVVIAVTKSTSRSTTSGGETAVKEKTISAMIAEPVADEEEGQPVSGGEDAGEELGERRNVDAVKHQEQEDREIEPDDEGEEADEREPAEVLAGAVPDGPQHWDHESGSPASSRRETS